MHSPFTRAAPLLPAGSPRIVGIVNITEDSFSDGGSYLNPEAALAHARSLSADGADVIELGPAASHPGSAPVSADEERRRLAPVLERLAADGIAVSVDSFRLETLRFAVSARVAYLNDIHGFGDPGLYPVMFGVPVLVSPSRKSFLRALTGRDVTQSGPATLAAEIFAAWQGADYIRTHDVAAARDALTFLSAVSGEAAIAWPGARGERQP